MDHLLKTRKKTKIKQAGVSRYIFQNELCRACSQHDMAYGDFEDLTRRIVFESTWLIFPKYLLSLWKTESFQKKKKKTTTKRKKERSKNL